MEVNVAELSTVETQLLDLSRSPWECVMACDEEDGCTMWTWTRGKCLLMSGSTWTKEPEAGSISGVAGQHHLDDPLTGSDFM